MINSVTTTKCFSAFNSSKHAYNQETDAPPKVKVLSLIGSGIGALGAAYFIAQKQGRVLNKPVGMFGIKYSEPELTGVAVGSILGGLIFGGVADDKKYLPIKVKEGIHQTVANVLAPLLLISGMNKIYDKYPIKKLPQFAENKGIKKFANEAMKMLPRLGIAVAGLVCGVMAGTVLSNKINGLEGTKQERHIKPIDYIYHPDDFAAAFAIADKGNVLQKFVSKIIPPVFMFHGYDTGTRR